jgi:hypothetical protein
VGGRQVLYERFELADRLRAEDLLDPLGVLLRGEATLGEGLAQDVRGPVAVGVGGPEVGVLPKVGSVCFRRSGSVCF